MTDDTSLMIAGAVAALVVVSVLFYFLTSKKPAAEPAAAPAPAPAPAATTPAAAPAKKSPRAAKSPARSPGRPAKSPPPSRPDPSPTPKPSASAVRQRKGTPKKKAEEKEAPETATGAAEEAPAPEAAAPAPAAAPPAPTPAPANGKGKAEPWTLLDYALVVIFVGLLGALAYTLYPEMGKKAKKPSVPRLTPKAFDGETLFSSIGYKGSALVAFTDPDCYECKELKPIFTEAKVALEGKLKFGQVDCVKYDTLCSAFGVTADDETALGLPWIGWFKGGVEQGGYTGEKTAKADFVAWYDGQAAANNLTAAD